MINLIIAIVLMCSSFGAVISKTTTEYGFRKQRQHTQPLDIDKNVLA